MAARQGGNEDFFRVEDAEKRGLALMSSPLLPTGLATKLRPAPPGLMAQRTAACGTPPKSSDHQATLQQLPLPSLG